jgi:uncharacterized membrane protein YeaQ/YmgE (transglycosylase-associated protein family)
MDIFLFAVIGCILGLLVPLIIKRTDFNMILNAITGMSGAIIGGWLFTVMGYFNDRYAGAVLLSIAATILFNIIGSRLLRK